MYNLHIYPERDGDHIRDGNSWFPRLAGKLEV